MSTVKADDYRSSTGGTARFEHDGADLVAEVEALQAVVSPTTTTNTDKNTAYRNAANSGFTDRGAWQTATDYDPDDIFYDTTQQNGYRVLLTHTSGIFSVDLAANRFEKLKVGAMANSADVDSSNPETVPNLSQLTAGFIERVTRAVGSTADYVWPARTKFLKITLVGGGGAGGGNDTTASTAGGGGAGANAKKILIDLSAVVIDLQKLRFVSNVGAGGVAVTGADGGDGDEFSMVLADGADVVLDTINAIGGFGGSFLASANAAVSGGDRGSVGLSPVITGVSYLESEGQPGEVGVNGTAYWSGRGGTSGFGLGNGGESKHSNSGATGGQGQIGSGYGGGGSGSCVVAAAAAKGGDGADGIAIIEAWG
jgi:hypothetical protein